MKASHTCQDNESITWMFVKELSAYECIPSLEQKPVEPGTSYPFAHQKNHTNNQMNLFWMRKLAHHCEFTQNQKWQQKGSILLY